MSRGVRAMVAALAVAAIACGGKQATVVQAVARGQLPVSVSRLAAIIELGDAVVVLADKHVTVVRGGIVAASAEAPADWLGGASIAAPDGEGRWAVGIAGDGSLWRITLAGELEPAGDRLGLARDHATALAGAGATTAAAIGDGIAATPDGLHLERVDRGAAPAPVAFAVARGRVALATADAVEVWDLAHATRRSYPLRGMTRLGFLDAASDASRLVISSSAVLYVEPRGGGGHVQRIAVPTQIRGIAISGARLWVMTAGAAYVLDGDTLSRVAVLPDAEVATLVGSPTGDVWLVRAKTITRYAIDRGGSDAETSWQRSIAPVFTRVCAHCHLPGGDAGVDLSTAASWVGERDELRRRVLVTKTMPPAGTMMSDADRAAIAGWLGGP